MGDVRLVDVVAEKIAELSDRRKALTSDLADARRDAATPAGETWDEFRSLAALLKKDPTTETRRKVQAAIRRAIESVHVVVVGVRGYRVAGCRVQFRNSERHRDYIVRVRTFPGNPKVPRRPVWEVLSGLPAGKLDLRKPADAAKVKRVLEKLVAPPAEE
jgi:hypothetical protein